MNTFEYDFNKTKQLIEYDLKFDDKHYDKLFFSANECIPMILKNVDFNDKRVLSVLSSGDQVFNICTKNVSALDLFDINKLSMYYYYLRIWIMKYTNQYYPQSSFDKRYLNYILGYVKPTTVEEVNALNFWIQIRNLGSDRIKKLFSGGRTIPVWNNKTDPSKVIKNIEKTQPKFYCVDMASSLYMPERYDIIYASNIAQWILRTHGSIDVYVKNLSNLLNDGGIVLCSCIDSSTPNRIERDSFEREFELHDVSKDCDYIKRYGYYYKKR